MPSRFYTEAMRDRLVDGTPTSELAKLWGKTPEQIRCMRYKVRKERGLSFPRQRRLTPDELKVVMSNQPIKLLAKKLGLTPGAVTRLRFKIRHGNFTNPVDGQALEAQLAAVKRLPF